MALPDAPIIELDTIDSTNNYAMRLIDADTAQHGLTIVTQQQTKGKGQRGRQWVDIPGQSLLMSIICNPNRRIDSQFVFNASIAVAVAEVLQEMYENWKVSIKWPNDIIINDKKAGGILIENILRGADWSYAIIGLGLNILQDNFPQELPYATSLKIASGRDFTLNEVRDKIRARILEYTSNNLGAEQIMRLYNQSLYRKGDNQKFTDGSEEWLAIIQGTMADGTLQVRVADGSIVHYTHGVVVWKWE
ncbi:MAG: biotin--[acetyl-CoA-carboxylase] ligase [Bacteroidetes bacterium]|nr:biotin--[acetyl-CoA-carboxylase] ligase [Bacteroidota bacterium]